MASNLPSSAQLLRSAFQSLFKEWKTCGVWLLGIVLFNIVSAWWMQSLVPTGNAMMEVEKSIPQGMGTWAFLGAVVSIALSVGLLRAFAQRMLPAGTKIRTFAASMGLCLLSGLISIPILGIAFLLLVVPFIWLSTSFGFSSLEIITAQKGPWSGLVSSFKLVESRWWAVFGRNGLFVLIAAGLGILFVIAVFIIGFIIGFAGVLLGHGAPSGGSTMVIAFVAIVLRALFTGFMTAIGFTWHISLYRALKTSKPS